MYITSIVHLALKYADWAEGVERGVMYSTVWATLMGSSQPLWMRELGV